jgi:hypothetical protein
MKQMKHRDEAPHTEDKEENEEAIIAAEETEIAAGERRDASRALGRSTDVLTWHVLTWNMWGIVYIIRS